MKTSWMMPLLKVAETFQGAAFLLTGAPGTGKTYFAEILAEDLGAGLFKISGRDDLRPEELFFRVVVGRGNQVEYKPSPLVEAMKAIKEGRHAVVLFDEVDKLRPRAGDLLLHWLEKKSIPSDLPGEHVEGLTTEEASRLVVVCTSNGRQELREELLRRIPYRITVGYPSRQEQRDILGEMEVPERCISPLLKVAEALRMADSFKAPAYTELKACVRAAQATLDLPLSEVRSLVEAPLFKGERYPIPFDIVKALRTELSR